MDEHTALRVWDAAGARGAIRAAAVAAAVAAGSATREPDAGISTDAFLDEPLGHLDRMFLRALRGIRGPRWDIETACLTCGEALDVTVDIDVLLAAAERPLPDGMRLPTSRALLAAEHADDPADAIYRWTLTRDADDASPDRGSAAMTLAEADPLLDAELVTACPTCESTVVAMPDAMAALTALARARVGDLLADVVAVARSTGWAERDILAMSARRRRLYLELIDA